MRKKLLSALTMGIFVAAGLASHSAANAATTNTTKSTAAKSSGAKKAKPAAATPAKAKKTTAADQWHATRQLAVASTAALVVEQGGSEPIYQKNADVVVPIASISKLMTAMVVLDAQLPLSETLTIGNEDVDTLKGTRSRLKVGAQLTREDMLLLALMASENRAASALSRHYPGGSAAFIEAMNHKAAAIGLKDTRFSDPTGLTAANVSSARDLTKMVAAAAHYPLIRELSTTSERTVYANGRPVSFHNTNTLVRSPASGWEIALQKTGYIREAGKCLVMQAWLSNRPVVIVLLDSWGRLTRIGDANRIKRWIENASTGGARPSASLARRTAG